MKPAEQRLIFLGKERSGGTDIPNGCYSKKQSNADVCIHLRIASATFMLEFELTRVFSL